MQETCLERYGEPFPLRSKELKDKMQSTMIERYGAKSVWQSDVLMGRIKQTNFERYGAANPSQSEEIKRKKRETSLVNYGVRCPLQSQVMRDRIKQTNLRKYGVECTFQAEEVKTKIHKSVLDRYGVDWACQRPEARKYSGNSEANREFAILLKDAEVDSVREFPIKSYSYDFKIGNILVEIDPTITHNTLWQPFGNHMPYVDETYHRRKTEVANGAGFHCIHIFDWDDKSKVISLLKSHDTVYAQECELREVPVSECDEFLNLYHLQNTCRGQIIRLGLYFHDELVSLMTFGISNCDKSSQFELLRYCSVKNVVGGADILFKTFVRSFSPISIVAYCDYSKFHGKVYEVLGFECTLKVSPSKHWYSPKEKLHVADDFLRFAGYDSSFEERCRGEVSNNEELMIARGYLPIYDCGQGIYYWEGS